jgi:glycosyltransferase involved in cell wall biosynthesis
VRVRPRVLMVTGAYFPELSGGGLQARAVVRALSDRVTFSVLTTSSNPALPRRGEEEGARVRRVFVDPRSAASQLRAAVSLALSFTRASPRFDIVNLHGFSRKAILLVMLSRLLRKRFMLTLQTGGHDEPAGVRALGPLAYWAYRQADLYVSVSPGLSRAYEDAGLPVSRLRAISNAVDTERFRPPAAGERAALRRELGLPADVAIVLFVGFFSRDKRPNLLFDAWLQTAADLGSALLFIGATQSTYQEVERGLADTIRERAAAAGVAGRVHFVESTHRIEKYFRAVDLYALPSIREGFPIALLEAMSSGLPCVATRLPGSTDVIIDHGANGLLAEPDDAAGFAAAVRSVLSNREMAARLGTAARAAVTTRFSIARTAEAWLAAYRELAAPDGSEAVSTV